MPDAHTTPQAFEQKVGRREAQLRLAEVVSFLQQLSGAPPAEHAALLGGVLQRATAAEVRWLLKLVQKDLKLAAGPRVVLSGLHPQAYAGKRTCACACVCAPLMLTGGCRCCRLQTRTNAR